MTIRPTISESRKLEIIVGTARCRGTVGDFKSLPLEQQRTYLDLDIVGAFVRVDEKEDAGSGDLVPVK